jgi:hypothetical protein
MSGEKAILSRNQNICLGCSELPPINDPLLSTIVEPKSNAAEFSSLKVAAGRRPALRNLQAVQSAPAHIQEEFSLCVTQ